MTGPLGLDGLQLVAVGASMATLMSAVWMLLPRRPSAAERVRPYAAAALSKLGRPTAVLPIGVTAVASGRGLSGIVVRMLHGDTADPATIERLRQSALYDVPPEQLLAEHRGRQVLSGVVHGVVGGGVAASVGLPAAGVVALAALATASGAFRPEARVDKAVEERRRLLRAEIPAFCQLLALRLRANGSVTASLAATLQRTRGLLSEELADAIAQHRAGRPLDQALDRVATTTPEPEAARVHRLLAGSLRHGLDAAPELLRLAREARAAEVSRMRRTATARRGAMLGPTVGLLAPQMLLFIAAPLPGLVLGG